MGKQKDFRHVHHPSHKKKDKKLDKTSKPSRASVHIGFLKNVEGVVQAELESAASNKKFDRKTRKELERYPLLAKAVFLGCERVVDNILDAGENINVQIPDGSTSLIIAVENGFPGIVQKLLKKGADPKLLRQDGRNALMIAVSKNDNRSFTLIWNYWDKSNFWELNHSDSRGYTALTIAVENGHSQITKFLLSLNGIEIDKQTEDGQTPLMIAVSKGQICTVKQLIANGSDIALEDKFGATAVCLAISQNECEIKKMLIESLDSKSRDVYVKKRVELLSRPRTDDSLIVISFYKDILFRVLLEVRRTFEDGIALLQKYSVFEGLLKCMETHQQDSELLRIGFHLSVCIMYDKAEYSRYIVDELAEQFVRAKGPDLSLKVMANYRIKSLSDLRGAAFLPIHACTQCRTGKEWLKENYFQVLRFMKEFKMIFASLTFWANGESVKARIMFERFEEILKDLEKDMKMTPTVSPDASTTTAEAENQESASKNVPIAENSADDSMSDQQWCLVSNSKSTSNKSTQKVHGNQAGHPYARGEGKRKGKRFKLQNKLQRKLNLKKTPQRPDVRYIPGHCSNLPALDPGVKFSQTGYADALKKNLKNEVSFDRCINDEEQELFIEKSKDFNRMFSDYSSTLNSSFYSYPIEGSGCDISKQNAAEGLAEDRNKQTLHKINFCDLTDEENRRKVQELCDLWKKVSLTENPVNLMTILMDTFKSNATKNKLCDKFSKSEIWNQNSREKKLQKSRADEDIANLTFPPSPIGLKTSAVQDLDQKVNDSSLSDESNLEALLNKTFSEKEYSATENTDKEGASATRLDSKSNLHPLSIDADLNSTLESVSSSEINCSNCVSENDSSLSPDKSIPEASEIIRCCSDKRKYDDTYLDDLCFNLHTKDSEQRKDKLTPKQINSEQEYSVFLKTGTESNSMADDSKKLHENENKEIPLHISKGSNNYKSLFSEINSYSCPLLHNVCAEPNPVNSTNVYTNSIAVADFAKGDFNVPPIKANSPKIDGCQRITRRSKSVAERLLQRASEESQNRLIKERMNSFNSVIDRLITEISSISKRSKLNYKSSSKKNVFMSLGDVQMPPKNNINGLHKHILMCHRQVLNKVINPIPTSAVKENKSPASEKDSASSLHDMEPENQRKGLPLFPAVRRKIQNDDITKEFQTIHENYDCLLRLKEDISKFNQGTSLQFNRRTSTKLTRIYHRKSIRGKKMASRIKNGSPKFENCDKLSFENMRIAENRIGNLFKDNVNGYIPNFINCESSSRWYKLLRKIESCIPFASLLGGSAGTAGCHTQSLLHELVCAFGRIIFSSKPEHILCKGKYGTYLGLLGNGNPIVVRELEKSTRNVARLLTMKGRIAHKNIVTFYTLCENPVEQKLFTITELCEYSLSEYMKMRMPLFDGKYYVEQLVEAVKYLHGLKVVHGFLKPSNIMITIDYRLKVADFYKLDVSPLICGIVRNDLPGLIRSSLPDVCWRPYELVAASNESEAKHYLSPASDIQMTGMCVYYILSDGKHPFGSNHLQCQENIRSGIPEMGPKPTDVESRDLICDMIRRLPSSRLSIQKVMKHPYFWSCEKRFQFLVAIGRKIEFYRRKPAKITEAFQNSCIEARDWTCYIHVEILAYIKESTNKTYLDNFADLLQFAVGLHDHFEMMPPNLQRLVQQPSLYILRTFPTIFMSVFCVVRDIPCAQPQMSLQVYF